jgi:hypothetical protein
MDHSLEEGDMDEDDGYTYPDRDRDHRKSRRRPRDRDRDDDYDYQGEKRPREQRPLLNPVTEPGNKPQVPTSSVMTNPNQPTLTAEFMRMLADSLTKNAQTSQKSDKKEETSDQKEQHNEPPGDRTYLARGPLVNKSMPKHEIILHRLLDGVNESYNYRAVAANSTGMFWTRDMRSKNL